MANLPRVGIDIGAASIKAVELSQVGSRRWRLGGWGMAAAASGGLKAQTLAGLVKERGIKSREAVVSLPEEKVSTHVVEMPLMSDEEVSLALQWQVEQYVPMSIDQAVWSHQVITRDKDRGVMEVLLVAAARNLVEAYTEVVEHSGLRVVAVETELVAAARALTSPALPLTLVVDVGAKSTDIGLAREGTLFFARSIPTAAEAFARAIETNLGLDWAQAEKYRNTYGFAADKLEGKLVEVMKPVLMVIAAEAKKTVEFYESKHGTTGVKSVVLSGGGSLIPEILPLFSNLVGLEVRMADPFSQVVGWEDRDDISPALLTVAVGSAMRGYD